jgi:RNA polymerase sigma factor (sigma-70 family)
MNNHDLERIGKVVSIYMASHPAQATQYEAADLVNETVLVLLEGYGGAKLDGDLQYSVLMAARRLARVDLKEKTGHDFTYEEGSSPSGRRNTEDDFVQQIEIDDWVASTLTQDQQFIVSHLVDGFTQDDIAAKVGVSSSTIQRAVEEIREIAKEHFDVN